VCVGIREQNGVNMTEPPKDAVQTPYGMMTPMVEIARVNLTGPAAAPPRLAPGAEWASVVIGAFERAHYEPADMTSVILRVKAIYPATGERETEKAASDFDPAFSAWLKEEIAGSPWADRVSQIHVQEEWRDEADIRIEIGIYGMRA
jgi:hypothetical protein